MLDDEDKLSTAELTHRLFRKYDTNEKATNNKYIVATQVRSEGSYVNRTADAVIVGNWPSVGYEIQGFEIKVSRSDWLNEVKKPGKCDAVKKYCNKWWLLIARESMVKEGELPEDWGMMVAHSAGLRIVKEAPELEPEPPSVPFITGLMRANKRDTIPSDLHAQYIQDNNRRIEAKLKKEFADLKQFVKFIHQAFGIELKQEREWTREFSDGGEYVNRWTAKIRSNYKHYSPEELKALIELVLSGDLDKAKKELRQAYDEIQSATEILDKYKHIERY